MIKYAVVEDNQVTETFTGLPLSWRNTSGFNLIGDDVEDRKSTRLNSSY